MVTFTEEIFNGKPHFLCSGKCFLVYCIESARQHNTLSPFTLVLFVLTVLLALIFHQQQLKVTLTVEKYDDKSHIHREGKEKENENEAIVTDFDDTESITNFFDHTILSFLEEGEQLLKEFKYKECEQFFEKLQKEFPSSPRAVYGRARCMEKLADRHKDGKLLEEALEEYMKIVKIPSVPPQLANRSLTSYGKKYLYLKMPYKAIDAFRQLLAYFPNDPFALNQLGLSLLHIGEYEESLTLFQRVFVLFFLHSVLFFIFPFKSKKRTKIISWKLCFWL